VCCVDEPSRSRPAASDPESIRLRNERVMANQGLVHSIARGREFRNGGLSVEDMVQEGNRGLMRAAELFDEARGLRFSTYASYWIRQAIFRGIVDGGRPIRVPAHARKKMKEVDAYIRTVWAETGVSPSVHDAVDAMSISGERRRRKTYRRAAEALRATFGEVPDSELADVDISTPDPLSSSIADEQREQMARALPLLSDSHRQLLTLMYGLDGDLPVSLTAAARRMGICVETAHVMHRNAVRRLRKLLNR
jgi:RNA polymerase primary sigma factor